MKKLFYAIISFFISDNIFIMFHQLSYSEVLNKNM